MHLSLPAIESAVDAHIANERYEDALNMMVIGVHQHYTLPQLAHKFLYLPYLDQKIQQLADVLAKSAVTTADQPLSINTLIIATVLGEVGGHSRVIADVIREVPQPTLVLTDTFLSSRAAGYMEWVLETYKDASVIVLPQQYSLWSKCQALFKLTERLQPRNILYFNHHQDPIPFVGTVHHPGSKKTLIHHCDHNPSLGNTLTNVMHVDFTEELADTCSKHLDRSSLVLPLYAPDMGKKNFSPITNRNFSVVTSGTSNKFARTGVTSLESIAQTILNCVEGKFFHIGPIDEVWVASIKDYLQQRSIDPQRFVPLGSVASLWGALVDLDAHVYLGSAPIGGGRAAAEAQGAGYPVVFFRANDPGSALEVESIYADRQLGWRSLDELSNVLSSTYSNISYSSELARKHYEQRLSLAAFKRVLNEVTNNLS